MIAPGREGRNPRLLVCCVNYAPEILGTAPYTRDLAEWFAGRGWDVRVVTTYPYYPAWRRRPGDPRFAYRRDSHHGVMVLRCPSWIPALSDGPRRLAHYASFAASSLPVVSGMPLGGRTSRSWSHRRWRARRARCWRRAWLEAGVGCTCRTTRWTSPFGWGCCPPPAARSLKWLERRLLRSFDVVTSITEPMLGVARDLGVPDERLVLLPNWANLAVVRPLDRPSVSAPRSASPTAGGSSCTRATWAANRASP